MVVFAGALRRLVWGSYGQFLPRRSIHGDTAASPIGGMIAVFAIDESARTVLPLLCGIFVIELYRDLACIMVQYPPPPFSKKKYCEAAGYS